MSQSLGMQTHFTVTCLRASAQTPAAAPRRGQPACRTCRFAPCPSLHPSHPFLRTSQCLASGVPSHHHRFIRWQLGVCVCVLNSLNHWCVHIMFCYYHGFHYVSFSANVFGVESQCFQSYGHFADSLTSTFLISCHIRLPWYRFTVHNLLRWRLHIQPFPRLC